MGVVWINWWVWCVTDSPPPPTKLEPVFYSTLVYIYLSVTLVKVTLGKDCHIHIHIYACTHGHLHCTSTVLSMRWRLKRLLWRDGEEESATEYFRLVEGEGFCCSLYKQPLMNTINNKMGVTTVYTNVNLIELLALTPSNHLDVSVHATSV